jgi:hypothetical protein
MSFVERQNTDTIFDEALTAHTSRLEGGRVRDASHLLLSHLTCSELHFPSGWGVAVQERGGSGAQTTHIVHLHVSGFVLGGYPERSDTLNAERIS